MQQDHDILKERIWTALEREVHTREGAFTLDRHEIMGIWVRPLTLRMHATLKRTRNLLIGGGFSTEDVIRFLVICHIDSYAWTKESHEAIRKEVTAAVAKITVEERLAELRDACVEYINCAFLDSHFSISKMKDSAPDDLNVSWTASIIHLIANKYGWLDETILDLPLSRVWQYIKQIQFEGAKRAGLTYGEQNDSRNAAIDRLHHLNTHGEGLPPAV